MHSSIARALVLAALGLFATGCTSLLPGEGAQAPEPTARCRSLDRRFRTYGVLARVGGAGAVSSGIGSAATDDGARVAFGASALTFGLLAATTGFLQSRAAASYVRECTINTGAPSPP